MRCMPGVARAGRHHYRGACVRAYMQGARSRQAAELDSWEAISFQAERSQRFCANTCKSAITDDLVAKVGMNFGCTQRPTIEAVGKAIAVVWAMIEVEVAEGGKMWRKMLPSTFETT